MTDKTVSLSGYSDEALHEIMQNSFHNFHVKGFDYICLERTPQITKKVYFFEGNVAHLPEVVNPHNHRYNFSTKVLSGKLLDTRYMQNGFSQDVYQVFKWKTPLNGGDGFAWSEEMGLTKKQEVFLEPGLVPYRTGWEQVHTIKIIEPQTVLMLHQYCDVIPLDEPTFTFMKERQPPCLDGLYDRFTMDGLIARLSQIKEMGIAA